MHRHFKSARNGLIPYIIMSPCQPDPLPRTLVSTHSQPTPNAHGGAMWGVTRPMPWELANLGRRDVIVVFPIVDDERPAGERGKGEGMGCGREGSRPPTPSHRRKEPVIFFICPTSSFWDSPTPNCYERKQICMVGKQSYL